MKLPEKITPCPIVESLIEVRFESELPGEAIFGIIYSALRDAFPKLEKLPILQLPEIIRSQDKNLIYAPHYKLESGNYTLQIGPKVFSLANINKYVGWETFFKEIKKVFKKIDELKIIKKIDRLGLRYINIFPNMNIFEKSDLSVLLKENRFVKNVNLVVTLPANEFINTLRMVSDTQIEVSGKVLSGSVIDIDTSLSGIKSDFFSNMDKAISDAHLEEKKLFFSLLKDEYIKTLNPEYQ